LAPVVIGRIFSGRFFPAIVLAARLVPEKLAEPDDVAGLGHGSREAFDGLHLIGARVAAAQLDDASEARDRERVVVRPVARRSGAESLRATSLRVAVGKCSSEKSACRPSHDLNRLSPRETGDIAEPDEGFDTDRAPDRVYQSAQLSFRDAPSERLQRFLEPADHSALSQQKVLALILVGFEGQPQHGAEFGFLVDQHARHLVHDTVESRGNVVRRVCAEERASLDLRISGHEHGPLVRKVAIGSGARDASCIRGLLDRRRLSRRHLGACSGDDCLSRARLLARPTGFLI
ncbi:MAG TPA: hypothetical protein VIL81_00125, partial [Candidatus Limnocylindrales bacterium]